MTVEGEGGTVWVGYQASMTLGPWTILPTEAAAVAVFTGRIVSAHPVWKTMTPTHLTVRVGLQEWRWNGPLTVEGEYVEMFVHDRPQVRLV